MDCVDNHLARREINRAEGIVISSGNGYYNGQVVIGNTNDPRVAIERSPYDIERGVHRHLPTAYLLFPDLLEPEPLPEEPTGQAPPEASCAEQIESGLQHLLVNDLMGNIVAHYCYNLVHRRPIRSFATFIDGSELLTARSVPITDEALLNYLKPHLPRFSPS